MTIKANIRLRHPETGEYYIGRIAQGMGRAQFRLGPVADAVYFTSRNVRYYTPRLKKTFGVKFIEERVNAKGTYIHPSEGGSVEGGDGEEGAE